MEIDGRGDELGEQSPDDADQHEAKLSCVCCVGVFNARQEGPRGFSVSKLDKAIQLHVALSKEALTMTEGTQPASCTCMEASGNGVWEDGEGAWSRDGCEKAGIS